MSSRTSRPFPISVHDNRFPTSTPDPVILTHCGVFHADDVISCSLLSFVDRFRTKRGGVVVARMRQENLDSSIPLSSIVVDCGSVCDPSQNRFDHHQADFAESFNDDFETKLSSTGLVWKHFGEDILLSFASKNGCTPSGALLLKLYTKFYRECVEEVDADDNGITVADECRFVQNSTFPIRVKKMNVPWNRSQSFRARNAAFISAFHFARTRILETLNEYFTSFLPARYQLIESIRSPQGLFLDSRALMIPFSSIPYNDHIHDLETEGILPSRLLFVVFRMGSFGFAFQCVKAEGTKNAYSSRVLAPEGWRGLEREECSEACGVEGCRFVHVGGWMGCNETLEGLVRMLNLIVEDLECHESE